MTTTTTEHVITVTQQTAESFRTSCSCGKWHTTSVNATSGRILGEEHIAEATRPTVARARALGNAARRAGLTDDESHLVWAALRNAADVADGIDKVGSRKRAVDYLLQLVRGEA